ncbi:MAG: hypothetical protein ACOX36_02815 [Saccharofermentanales bacterium]|jgi:hypothetical protein
MTDVQKLEKSLNKKEASRDNAKNTLTRVPEGHFNTLPERFK